MGFHRQHRSNNLCNVDDDSSSVSSSTVSVDGCSSCSTPLHDTCIGSSTSRKRRNSSVCFDLDANEEHDHPLWEDECADNWYNYFDYKCFKRSTMMAVQALIRFEAKNDAANSYQRVMERTYKTCENVTAQGERDSYTTLSTPQERLCLHQWVEVAPDRLGLEKWAMRKLLKDIRRRRDSLIDFVLDIQDVRVKNCTEDIRAEFIRRKCEHISRPSRMFALALAKAYSSSDS